MEWYYRSLENEEEKIGFVNNILAMPYQRTEYTTAPEDLLARRENYNTDFYSIENQDVHLPDGLAIITAGIDIQKNRIECSIIGWGYKLESWHLKHYIISAFNTENINDPCWKILFKLLTKTWKLHNGAIVGLENAFIDMSYNTGTVLSFIKTYNCATPIKGVTRGFISTVSHRRDGIYRKDLNVNSLKGIFFALLEKDNATRSAQGYCHFPMKADHIEFYKQLVSEYRVVEKGKEVWIKKRKQNECLDCRIYALAGAYDFGIDLLEIEDIFDYIAELL